MKTIRVKTENIEKVVNGIRSKYDVIVKYICIDYGIYDVTIFNNDVVLPDYRHETIKNKYWFLDFIIN